MDIPPWMLAPLRDELEDHDWVRKPEEIGQSHGPADQSIRFNAGLVVIIVYDARRRSF
jgi:hypothetical protein